MMSLLSWERGLKYYAYVAFKWSEVVAPNEGAWIEISKKGNNDLEKVVAPKVGGWFEIANIVTIYWDNVVAPLVGAWIEIKE